MDDRTATWEAVAQQNLRERERLDRKEKRAFILGCVLAAVLAIGTVAGAVIAFEALASKHQSSSAATRRIDLLTKKLDTQTGEIANLNLVVGELRATQDALVAQLRAHGIAPIVVIDRDPSTSTTSTTAPPSTTTTTRPPSTTTTTTPPPHCRRVVGICAPGG